TPTPLAARQSAWSPSSAATLAAVVLLHGGFGAAMVGASALLTLRRHVPLYERLFNGAMYAVAGYEAGVAYLAVRKKPDPFTPHLLHVTHLSSLHGPHLTMFEALLWPFAVAALVHVLVNHGLLWGMLLLDQRSRAATRSGESPAALPLLLAYDI